MAASSILGFYRGNFAKKIASMVLVAAKAMVTGSAESTCCGLNIHFGTGEKEPGQKHEKGKNKYSHMKFMCWDHFSQQMSREGQRINNQYRVKEARMTGVAVS